MGWLFRPFETVNGAVPGIGRATVLQFRSHMSPKVFCMRTKSQGHIPPWNPADQVLINNFILITYALLLRGVAPELSRIFGVILRGNSEALHSTVNSVELRQGIVSIRHLISYIAPYSVQYPSVATRDTPHAAWNL